MKVPLREASECAWLQVHNPCSIPADCKLFIEGRDSAFAVEPREMHLEPGQTELAKITLSMDDTRVNCPDTCLCT